MISNLVAQLREMEAVDKLDEVLKELPRTRKDMGYPPLVTPSSQIVGVQAVNNVLFGRYQRVTDQVKDYAYGLYGRPPAPMDPEFVKLALTGYKRGTEPITRRPADVLEPELEKAKEATKDVAKDIGDILTYALYPTTGIRFLRWKYGLEPVPDEVKLKTLEQVRKEDELIDKIKKGELSEKDFVDKKDGREPVEAPPKSQRVRAFNVYIGDQYFRVEVDPADGSQTILGAPVVGNAALATAPARTPAPPPAKAPEQPAAAQARAAATTAVAAGEVPIKAPMPGIVIRYLVEEGQKVKAGEMVVVLEAMKMENALPSPVEGVVKKLSVAQGKKVAKEDILAIIATS
jgi:pyruvate carboxylase subunit B